MKKLLIAFLAALLCVLLAAAANAEVDSTWYEVTAGDSPFLYSDLLLSGDEYHLDGDLAKISAALSVAAYNEGTVTTMLEQMGFDQVKKDYTNHSIRDPHHVGYAIGQKISGDYVIYCVAVRGTPINYEWLSNFTCNPLTELVTKFHTGFYLAELEVMSALSSLVNSDGHSSENRIFLLTGHSRGAAVANIMAGKLTEEGKGHVFGYTFACPQGCRFSASMHSNIYNFVFKNDLVARVAPIDWGYTRYGSSIEEDAFSYLNVYSDDEMNAIINMLSGLAPGAIQTKLLFSILSWGIAGEEDSAFDSFVGTVVENPEEYKVAFSAGINILSGGTGGVTEYAVVSMGTDYKTMVDFWKEHSNEIAALTSETWDDYRNDDANKKVFALYDEVAGRKVTSYEQLSALIEQISQRYDAISNISPVIDVLDVFFEYNPGGLPQLDVSFLSKVLNAHSSANYLAWMNQTYYGYEGCKGRTFNGIDLRPNVRTISPYCFANTSGEFALQLDSVLAFGDYAFNRCEGKTVLDLSDTSKYFSIYAFKHFFGLQELILAADFDYGFNNTFTPLSTTTSYLTSLKKITYTPGKTGVMADRNNTLFPPEYDGQNTIETIEFKEGVTHIAAYLAGYASDNIRRDKMSALKTVIFPSTLESIGEYAFARCINLSEFALPQNLIQIGNHAFYECTGPEELNLPMSLTEIENCTFSGCHGIKTLIIPNTIEAIGSSAFACCSGITELNIPDSIVSIEWGTFTACSGIIVLNIPDSIVSIGDSAFRDCSGIRELRLPDTVTNIGNQAFMRCSSIQEVTLPDAVVNVGNQAFCYCTSLSSITLPADHKFSVNDEFERCTSIKKITYTAGKTGIMADRSKYSGSPEYYGRDSVETIVFEEGITHIAAYFAGWSVYISSEKMTALKTVVWPSTLESIGEYAFLNCESLPQIILPSGVSSISEGAFLNIPAKVYCYKNTYVEQWAKRRGKTIVYLEMNKTMILPASIREIEEEAFFGSAMQMVIIPSGAERIGARAFADCMDLRTVIVPDSVIFIADDAFANCGDVVIHCSQNSYAAQYAEEHNLNTLTD